MAYIGFKNLEERLRRKGVQNPGGLARFIGVRKYSAKVFNKAAAEGKSLRGHKPAGK